MGLVGPINYTDAEIQFAQTINDAFEKTNSENIDQIVEFLKATGEKAALFDEFRDKPLIGRNFPGLDENIIRTGSTDVGDLSQVVPVSLLRTTCTPTGCPGHSWGNVAASGMSIGHKGMMHAAKIMAGAAVELYSNPLKLQEVRDEFDKSTRGKPYVSPIPEGATPPRYELTE